jgi:hypothetical protein
MEFLNREDELQRLERLVRKGGLAVIWGRRRIDKTRLLLEWCKQHAGLYTVADQSAATIQRRYFAVSLATRFPGFDQVEYPDWRPLLKRISAESMHQRWRGPLIVDEFPYLTRGLPDFMELWNGGPDGAERRRGEQPIET